MKNVSRQFQCLRLSQRMRLVTSIAVLASIAACTKNKGGVATADSAKTTVGSGDTIRPSGQQLGGTAATALQNYLSRLTPEQRDSLDIPLNTDSQRLANSTLAAYGATAIVKAHPQPTPLDDIKQYENGVLVATFEIRDDAYPTNVDTYGWLYVSGPGQYCVRLRSQQTGNVYKWERAYVDKATSSGCDPAGPINTAQPLDVFPGNSTYVGNTLNFPNVARWTEGRDGNPNNRRIGVVVKCADNECELLPKGAQPLPPGLQGVPGNSKRTDIKLWHDEQTLAITNSGPKPSRVDHAAVVPTDRVEAITNDNDYGPAPVDVAYVIFSQPPAINSKYWSKGFTRAVNTISIQKGNSTKWGKAWINGDIAHAVDVVRKPHSPAPSATTRWLWRDNDEAVWVRCGSGCCEADF